MKLNGSLVFSMMALWILLELGQGARKVKAKDSGVKITRQRPPRKMTRRQKMVKLLGAISKKWGLSSDQLTTLLRMRLVQERAADLLFLKSQVEGLDASKRLEETLSKLSVEPSKI